MNMIQALNSAMDVMMARDPSVVVMGEDVGYFGGVFRVTDGLQRKYGDHRVLDSPISEGGIVATAIGMAVNGLKPVARDPVRRLHLSRRGPDRERARAHPLPQRRRFLLARRDPRALRRRHPRRPDTFAEPEAIFTHICGVKVVMPSNPYDAKGLLIAAIEDDDPIIFFEPKRIYNGPFDGDPNKPRCRGARTRRATCPRATTRCRSASATSCGRASRSPSSPTAPWCTCARRRRRSSTSTPRSSTCAPCRRSTSTRSVLLSRKTGRCVVAHEATRFSGFGAELSASIQEECFWYLEAPIQRVAGWDTPYPHAFEWEYFPGQARVALALRAAMGQE
jgi:2-oxoisovalerate dehydrogenase E1 component beta subunit